MVFTLSAPLPGDATVGRVLVTGAAGRIGSGFLRHAAGRLPRAAVPDDHGARAVIAGWNFAFERAVLERMILHVHGQPLHRRIETGSLGYRPRLQRPVEFEPEVVMQAPGVMLLNQIRERRLSARACRLAGTRAARRLRRFFEAPLFSIGLELVSHADPSAFSHACAASSTRQAACLPLPRARLRLSNSDRSTTSAVVRVRAGARAPSLISCILPSRTLRSTSARMSSRNVS